MLGVRVIDTEEDKNAETTAVSRDDWMTKPMKREVRGQEKASEQVVVEDRHVNPTNVVKKDFTVGDGGASWRMKALKRAQVQASVEGASLSEVVGQRWTSVAELAGAAEHAAPPDAHNRSIKNRKRGDGKMKRPREGVSWRSREGRHRSRVEPQGSMDGYSDVLHRAAKDMNSFKNDGGFLDSFHGTRGEARHDIEDENPEEQKRTNSNSVRRRHDSPERDSQSGHGRRSNTSVAAMLRARLSGRKVTQEESGADHVVLPLVDAQGRAAPGAFGRETAAQIDGGMKPQKRFDRYKDGEKTRYFATDDTVDLDTMVKRTKHGMEEDMDDIIARNISKKSHYKGNEFDPDDEYDYDGGVEFLETGKASKQSRRRGDAREEVARREKQKQVRDYQRLSRALDACRLCFASPSRRKHLTVSVATSAYLALPEKGRLVPGHCCVVPIEHIPSARLADETTWEEMRNFKKCVLQMFSEKGMDCIFFETVTNIDSTRAHAMVECVPVSTLVAAKAPMYFKKAIDDATEDWSQHAAKRCIETESRHLQKKIPPNFPYFHVEFGLAAGFVHVIDNPKEFDPLFARRILVGLLGLPEKDMHSKVSREGEEIQRQWVKDFRTEYNAYDWVQQT